MSTHHHHALWRRVLSALLVFSLLIGSMPPATPNISAVAAPTTSPGAVPLPDPANARVTIDIPSPPDAQSTSYPADYIDTLRAQYGARHNLGNNPSVARASIANTDFDGTFSTPSSQTGSLPGPFSLSGFGTVTTTLVVPAGFIRDSLKVDVSITNYRIHNVRAEIAHRPLGATEWSTDAQVLVNEGPAEPNGPSVTTNVVQRHVSLGGWVPLNTPMELQLECGGLVGVPSFDCTWSNFNFFHDIPGWTSNFRGSSELATARVQHQTIGGIPAATERGPFLAWTIDGSGGVAAGDDYIYRSPLLNLPPITSTDVVTASVWWARNTVDDNPGYILTGVDIQFRPQDSDREPGYAYSLVEVPNLTIFDRVPIDELDDWTYAEGEIITNRLREFGGQPGWIEIVKQLGQIDHTFAIDSIQLYINGNPVWTGEEEEDLKIPDDQQAGECNCDSCAQGQIQDNDPVNTCQGSFNIMTSDLSVGSTGPSLTFGRSYTSLLADLTTYPTSTMGPGWSHTFAHKLTLPDQVGGEPDTLIYEAPTGNRLRYLANGDGTYRTVVGVRGNLVQDGNTYTLTRRDQSILVFDNQGRLTEQRTSAGHRQTLSYYSGTGNVWDGELQQVTDVTTGRFLTLTYQNQDGVPRLASIRDHTNRTVSYTYNPNGDLATVTDLRGGVTTYGYDGTTHLLTTITDPLDEVKVTNTYDLTAPNRPVIEQVERNGRRITYDYADTATGTSTTMTYQRTGEDPEVIVDHYRADGTFEFRERNGRFVRYTTFDNSLTPNTIVAGNGNATLRQHDAAGLPIETTNAANETSTATYRPDHRPANMITSDGIETTMAYDGEGNLTQLQQTNGNLQLTTVYSYTTDNRLRAEHPPDNVITEYTYDNKGQMVEMIIGTEAPQPQTIRYAYDDLGRVVNTTVGVNTDLARIDVIEYNNDDTIARTIHNYVDGVFDPAKPDEDITQVYGYDVLGRPIWMRDVLGRYDVTRYDEAGLIDWTTRNLVIDGWNGDGPLPTNPPAFNPATPDQNVTMQYEYDLFDRIVLMTETGLLSGSFKPQTQTFDDTTTRVNRTEYDELSRPTTITLNYKSGEPVNTQPDINVQTLNYFDGAGNITWQRDPLGRWTHIEYDAVNRPTVVTTNYENGNPLTVETANQSWTDGSDTDLITVTEYDEAGRVERFIENYVDGTFTATEPITDRITLIAYDELSRIVQTTANHDPNQSSRTDTNRIQVTTYAPETGQLRGQQDTLGRWTRYRYDPLGRIRDTVSNYVNGGYDPAVTDEDLVTRTYYDALGRVDRTIANAVNDVYDPTVADEDITTLITYDGVGRVVATTANYVAGGPTDTQTNVTTAVTYDGRGQVITAIDATGATAQLDYDALERPTRMTDSLSRITTVGYDGIGALRWTSYPDGQLTFIQVDGLSRPTTTIENYQNGIVGSNEPTDQDLISHSRYDLAGRVIETVDPAGRVTQFSYDLQDRMVAVTENVLNDCAPSATDCNTTTRYQYDRVGNQIATIDANGNIQRFSYDAANQQVEAFDGLNRRTGWQYDKGGRIVSQDDPRGVDNDLTWTYDGQDRLTGIDATNLDTIGMGYDALGRRTAMTDGTGTTTFTPDPLGRITEVTAPGTGTVGYGYTARGERSQLTYPDGTVVDYTYLADGRLDTVREGATLLADYGYDPLGRLQQAVLGNGAVTSYTYDNADRLRDLHTTVGDNTINRFQYAVDRLGLRTQVTETLGNENSSVIPTSGLGLWLRADAGVTQDGTGVTTWADQSGQGRDATAISATSQPTLVDNALNGQPALRFDGTDDGLTFDYPINGLTGMTMIMVTANASDTPTSTSGQRAALFWNETNNWGATFLSPYQRDAQVRFGTTQPDNNLIYDRPTSVNTTYSRTSAVHNGTTDTLYVNGNAVLTETGKLSTISGTRDTGNLGRGYNDDSFFHGDIVEVLVYSRALNEAELQQVDQYLQRKYFGGTSDIPQEGLGLWLRADAGVTQDGNQVTSWADQSGQGRTATVASAANQPTLVPNAVNGQPALRFDGNDDFLTFDYPITDLRSMTMVAVSANVSDTPTSPSGREAILFWNETSNWGATFLSAYQGAAQARFGTTQPNNNLIHTRPSSVGTDYTRTAAVHRGTTDVLYVDGTAVLTETGKWSRMRATTPTGNLGRGHDDNTFFHGDIVEVLVYSRALDETELQQVDQYLAAKYFGATSSAMTTIAAAETDEAPATDTSDSPPPDATAFGTRPLAFVPNRGQHHDNVHFAAQGQSGTVWFTADEAVLAVPTNPTETDQATTDQRSAAPPMQRQSEPPTTGPAAMTRLQLIDANANPTVQGADRLPGVVHDFRGNDANDWQRNVPTYKGIVYEAVYPGIDLHYTSQEGRLKRTYVVAPGSDPAAIHWRYDGAETVTVDADGHLQVTLATDPDTPAPTTPPVLTEQAPIAWQIIANEYVLVPVQYAVAEDGTVRFTIADYDPAVPLIIDPVLVYSTHLGGALTDSGASIITADDGSVYVVGSTASPDFPTTVPSTNSGEQRDVFVAQLNATGTSLLFAAYLGGDSWDTGYDLAQLPNGNIAVTGITRSQDFPTTNDSFEPNHNGLEGDNDAFALVLDPETGDLVYSTYIGGFNWDFGYSIDVDSAGHLYVVGETVSDNLPRKVTSFQGAQGGFDGFVVKIDPTASGNASLVYSSYLGGTGADGAAAVVVRADDSIIITGYSNSSDFPVTETAYQTTHAGGGDVFLTWLDPTANGVNQLRYGTYLGGDKYEIVSDLALDSQGRVALVGITVSDNFPVDVNAYQSDPGQPNCPSGFCEDAFVTSLDPTATGAASLINSTYLGGSSYDHGYGITVTNQDAVVVTGMTASDDFPTTSNALQYHYAYEICTDPTDPLKTYRCSDAFVAQFHPDEYNTWELTLGTYLGSFGDDRGGNITHDATDNLYLIGSTTSDDFPLERPIQGYQGSADAFITKIGAPLTPPTARTITYEYDGLMRLVEAVEDPGTSYRYSYDRVGNRTDGGRQYNAANEVIDFTYDAAGNLLNDGGTIYTYDALGRLTQQGNTGYTYNGDDVLVSRGNTNYTQDLIVPLPQILTDGTTNHIYGHERLLSTNSGWYHHDGLGSVRTILDGGGTIQSATNYDPWGVPIIGSADPFGFTGELHDDNLVHLRARWYNPSLGTFTSRDPFAGFATLPYSQHPYQYAYSNPGLWTDPSGKFAPALAGSIAAGAGIGAGVEIGSQLYDQYRRTGRVDLGNLCAEDIAYAALSGAIAGGIGFFGGPAASAVFGRGLGGSIIAGAVEGAISDSAATATLLLLRGQPVTADAMIQAAFSGALGGGVGGAIGRMWSSARRSMPRTGDAGWQPRTYATAEACSFSADTPVATEDGDVHISEVERGDQVLAYNETTGATDTYTVTATWSHEDPIVTTVTLDGEIIETTPEHPFYVLLRGWVPAADLREGDQVRQADDSYGMVEAVTQEQRPQVMYNITVAEAHTYFVGDEQWLVHNACDPWKRRVLVVGEDPSYEYSAALAQRHQDWLVFGATYDPNGLGFQHGLSLDNNFVRLGDVDATWLDKGSTITANRRFDAVIFNNPHAGDGQTTANLITEYITSARGVLNPSGTINIHATRQLLNNHGEVRNVLNVESTIRYGRRYALAEESPHYVGRFGQSDYYAPFRPSYTVGGFNDYYLDAQGNLIENNLRGLLHFRY